MRTLFLSAALLLTYAANAQKNLADSARNFFSVRSDISYCSPEWQIYIDSALAIDSTVATLWQWKGMPYFKNGDYAEAFRCYDKAVRYDSVRYLPLLAFMKLIFLKDNEGAIADFLVCKQRGYGVGLMDHSYDFFLGLAYKEAREFALAEKYLGASVDKCIKQKGENWVNYNEWFYMGMICLQQGKDGQAIMYFDKCLKEYPGYPTALYHKAMALKHTGKKPEAQQLLQRASQGIDKGMRSAEDSDPYVNYPDTIHQQDIDAAMAIL